MPTFDPRYWAFNRAFPPSAAAPTESTQAPPPPSFEYSPLFPWRSGRPPAQPTLPQFLGMAAGEVPGVMADIGRRIAAPFVNPLSVWEKSTPRSSGGGGTVLPKPVETQAAPPPAPTEKPPADPGPMGKEEDPPTVPGMAPPLMPPEWKMPQRRAAAPIGVVYRNGKPVFTNVPQKGETLDVEGAGEAARRQRADYYYKQGTPEHAAEMAREGSFISAGSPELFDRAVAALMNFQPQAYHEAVQGLTPIEREQLAAVEQSAPFKQQLQMRQAQVQEAQRESELARQREHQKLMDAQRATAAQAAILQGKTKDQWIQERATRLFNAKMAEATYAGQQISPAQQEALKALMVATAEAQFDAEVSAALFPRIYQYQPPQVETPFVTPER